MAKIVSTISPEYPLLGLLSQKPAHGYELHQRLTTDLGQVWRISQSQTYNILNRLEANGTIIGEVLEQEKLPARRRFHLTESGRQRFEAWLNSPSGSSARAIRIEFVTRLYFALARDREFAHRLIEAQISETQVSLQRLRAQMETIPDDQVFNRLGLGLRLRQLSSILDWLVESRTIVDFSETQELT